MLRVRQLPCQVVITALAVTMLVAFAPLVSKGITWSARKGPVPGALTSRAPA